MKRPSVASLKKVTPENLAMLGAERLAEILTGLSEGQAELKRQLRMELAGAQGAEHLAPEIDKRLATLQASQGRVSWRRRAIFVQDLDVLRGLITRRLADLDPSIGLDRLWSFMGLARPLMRRVHDRDGELDAVFQRAAEDAGRLGAEAPPDQVAPGLVEAIVADPKRWADWLPQVLDPCSPELAQAALRLLSEREGAIPGWIIILRQLADAAGDVDAYQATFTKASLETPELAADVAQRLLSAGRIEEAGKLLRTSGPAKTASSNGAGPSRAGLELDFAWEGAWIEYLERSSDPEAAQAARWASFERTLSMERLKAFTGRLADFQDVEAEQRAFAFAAQHLEPQRGLALLMDWPALPEAAAMIQARADELRVPEAQAELWAAKLRTRYPQAAHLLLRKAAAAAFRRRDFAASTRLTQEADAIGP